MINYCFIRQFFHFTDTICAHLPPCLLVNPYFTEPSKVINLISLNNDSGTIYAQWSSADNNSFQYSYKIILDNMIWVQNSFKFITPSPLTPGTKYTLNVLAIVPNCSDEGDAASISAYTSESQILLFLFFF